MTREMSLEEARWVKRLGRVLRDAPKTLELVTIGDASLTVICAAGARQLDDLSDGKCERAGIVLADVQSAVRIHGVSG